ncbi:MAG: AraC family transcriptional regulator [Bacteroidota bacterium]
MKFTSKTGEYFEVQTLSQNDHDILQQTQSGELAVLWFQSDNNRLIIDAKERIFNTNDIICLTEFHRVEVIDIQSIKFLKWNREFYCILYHDSAVGCKGVLFYGAAQLPIIHLSGEEIKSFELVWKVLEDEMRSHDNLQGEMLQMILKRILILCTRVYKSQTDFSHLTQEKNIDIVREYNFLVEKHFREKHTVAEYAELLHKSPKTLSNLFRKLGNKTPLQFIHERKLLEAQRLLNYTDKSVSEIGYEIGFMDVQSFSRFFKKMEGVSPMAYKG